MVEPVLPARASWVIYAVNLAGRATAAAGRGEMARKRLSSKRSRPARPRTHVGLWLRAVLLNGTPEIERLAGQLNGGKPGWNPDEPAVLEAACEQAMRQMFGTVDDRREIRAVVSTLREIPLPPGSLKPGHLEMERVVRVALGDRSATLDSIRPSVLLAIRDRLILVAHLKLAWSESDVDALIADAERIAFERGWKPPLAV
jgi:hypothetical protein